MQFTFYFIIFEKEQSMQHKLVIFIDDETIEIEDFYGEVEDENERV